MKQLFVFVFCFLIAATAYNQTGSISGKVTDSSSKKILSLATITVFKAKDTTIITYRLSGPDGEFKIPNLPFEIPLRVMVTYSGYEAYRKDFILTATKNSCRFDSVFLPPTSKQLDEVIVIAERPPVMIKKDTIEFNASAFKTLPNALVEDLLKKLPGVMVDADGNITVNGKAVNRILVDGKTFFGDDPKMATRNLPANIIDKVQVTDDKEELLKNGDNNTNNIGKVVNITLKKGVKKGWFGKMYAGAGTEERFEGGAIANVFRDTLQVSALAYANNLNKPGFSYSDLSQTAGLQRNSSVSGSSNTNISNNGSGGSITVNGVNFGGSTNGGIATSKGAGFNINHAPNLKKSFFLQYFYGNVETDKLTNSDVKQYNVDTIITNHTNLAATTFNTTHNIGTGIRLKPDSVTNFVATANYTVGLQSDYKNSNIYALNNILGPLSNGGILNNNAINSYYYRHSVSLIKLSKTKAGRRLVLSHNFEINNRFNYYNTNALIHYTYPSAYDSILQQQRNEGIPRTDLSVTANYTEPLTKIIAVRIISRYEYSNLNNAVNTFNKSSINIYDKFNPLLSSFLSRESDRLNSSINIDFKWKNITITPTLRALWQKAGNYLATLSSPVKQNQLNILPGFVFNYKQLYINYDEGIVLPSYNYLIPIPDNSNPYNIIKGNVNLLPTDRHNISINYYFNNPKKLLNVGLSGGMMFANNDIIQSIVVDNKGVQTNTPVNANGSQNAWLNYNINKQHKYSNNFVLAWNTGAYYEYNHTKLLYNGEDSWQTTNIISQWAGLNLNFNDKFEWNNSYSINYVFTEYTSHTFSKLELLRHFASTEFIVRWPKHVIWENSFNYSYNSNLPAGFPKDLLRWNAAINFTMLKDEKGILRFSVYNLLERDNNINMYLNRNLSSTTVNNILPRYFMATFTYNIRTIGSSKKKVGGERLFMF